MKAHVTITLKPGLLDAQGKTVKSALEHLGFKGVKNVRMGKYVEIELNGGASKQEVDRMCRKLLANPVIEQYRILISRG
jgi:phosphoribosylformylglycinamidine synthase